VSQRTSPTAQTDLREKPLFARFARWVERQVGRSSTFVLAIAVVLLWAASGPVFGWSDTWQLVINTGTTIVTFLMVFVIQNTQSRDTQAMQLKLDELIRVNEIARNSLINLRNVRTRCRTDEGGLRGARLTANCTTPCSGHGARIGRIAHVSSSFDKPVKDVMRVDRGDRRDVILLTCANGDVGGRQPSAHHSFRIGSIVIRPATRRYFCQRTSLAVCDPRSCETALSTRVGIVNLTDPRAFLRRRPD